MLSPDIRNDQDDRGHANLLQLQLYRSLIDRASLNQALRFGNNCYSFPASAPLIHKTARIEFPTISQTRITGPNQCQLP